MPESVVSDRDPRFTLGFWSRMFKLLGRKLYMSTAGHPQPDVQIERSNRVVEDVSRTIATTKKWSKHLPFVEFAINKNVYASTGETPFYVNGMRHPLGANAEQHNSVSNVMAEDRSSSPTGAAVVTAQESIKSESRHQLSSPRQ